MAVRVNLLECDGGKLEEKKRGRGEVVNGGLGSASNVQYIHEDSILLSPLSETGIKDSASSSYLFDHGMNSREDR